MTRRNRSIRPSVVAMRIGIPLFALGMLVAALRPGPGTADESPGETAKGKNFLPTRQYGADEDRALLKVFDGLRVADVSDGMDAVGLQDVGLMDPRIAPLWQDLDSFAHRFCGVAVTVRYVPTNKRAS